MPCRASPAGPLPAVPRHGVAQAKLAAGRRKLALFLFTAFYSTMPTDLAQLTPLAKSRILRADAVTRDGYQEATSS
jgi:hypothetical protein